MVDLMAAQAAIGRARQLLGLGDGVAVGGLAVWQLRLIDERIAGDPLPPSLNELAQLCGISPRHLTRAFRASRGCSIGEHLAAHRIEQSRQMLAAGSRSEEHTSELQSLMRISYAVFCLKKKKRHNSRSHR